MVTFLLLAGAVLVLSGILLLVSSIEPTSGMTENHFWPVFALPVVLVCVALAITSFVTAGNLFYSHQYASNKKSCQSKGGTFKSDTCVIVKHGKITVN